MDAEKMISDIGAIVEIGFHALGSVENRRLLFAVVMARHKGKWIFVRHKERRTWELPGGHREASETIDSAASRELYEETGAVEFKIRPLSVYSVKRGAEKTFGQLFYAEIEALDELPDSEIAEIGLYDSLPGDLTYPEIQPVLYDRVQALCADGGT